MRTNFSPLSSQRKFAFVVHLYLFLDFLSLFLWFLFLFLFFFQLKPVATEILAREELVANGRVRNLRVLKKIGENHYKNGSIPRSAEGS